MLGSQFAVQWDAISLTGAFLLGALFSAVVVLRLVRIIAEFLTRLGRPAPQEKPKDDTEVSQ